MTCHSCSTVAVKIGLQNGYQRYRCKTCKRTFSFIPERPLDDLRIDESKAYRVVEMLVEGIGIRAIERLTGLNRRTVLSILKVAGEKAMRFMEKNVRDVQSQQIQADEIYCFVKVRQEHNKDNAENIGEMFTYLGVDRGSKLIITHRTSKRTADNTLAFMDSLKARMAPDCGELITDGFKQYCGENGAVREAFGGNISYATETKYFARPVEFMPRQVIGKRIRVVSGNPNKDTITTNHVERTNLSVRLFTRRFTRSTLGYSKKLENLRYAVALFVCHFNFCRVHSSLGRRTPAMAAGLADRPLHVSELLLP